MRAAGFGGALALLASASFAQTPAATPAPAAAAVREPIVLSSRKPEDATIFEFDYGAPTSPALSLAGTSPDKTTTSTSLKPFVLSLPTVLDGSGNGQSVALDFAPAGTFWRGQTINAYLSPETPKSQRLWARSRIGVALLPGTDADKDADDRPSRVALGYSVSLLDSSDPFLATILDATGTPVNAWATCVDAATRTFFDAPDTAAQIESFTDPDARTAAIAEDLAENFKGKSPGDLRRILADPETRGLIDRVLSAAGAPAFDALTESEIVARITEYAERAGTGDTAAAARNTAIGAAASSAAFYEAQKACAVKAAAAARAAPDLDLGFGAVWSGEPGAFEELDDPGGAVWLAYRRPLRAAREGDTYSFAIGGSARFAWREAVASGVTATPMFLADTTDVWLGVEAIGRSLRFSAQYGWFDAQARDGESSALSQSGERYLLTGAIALGPETSGLWANVSYGASTGTTEAREDETLLVSLTFAPPKPADIFKRR